MSPKNDIKSQDPWKDHGGEHFLDLLIDSLQQLDQPVQQAFLQKLLKNVHKTPEPDSLTHWQEILLRQQTLAEHLGREVNLRTAAVQYFVSTSLLRGAVLLKHRELKSQRHTADTDPLTGLYNRRLLDEFLAKELNRSLRHGYPLALILCHISSLKQVRELYGPAAADALLVSLACACAESVRGYDYACRLGDDEFAVLLPQSDLKGGLVVAKRIAGKFDPDGARLAPKAGLILRLGVASAPEDAQTVETLFERADHRLYEEEGLFSVRSEAGRVPVADGGAL